MTIKKLLGHLKRLALSALSIVAILLTSGCNSGENSEETSDSLEALGIEPVFETESGTDIDLQYVEDINESVEVYLNSNYTDINGRAITYKDVIVFDGYVHDNADDKYCNAVAIADVHSVGGEYPDGDYYYAFNVTITSNSDNNGLWKNAKVTIDNLQFVEKYRAAITRDPKTNSISFDIEGKEE